ncbi:developmentally-regulated external PM-anchored protein [Acrasis kona]|uniref:Developmentally-regulated external PM-anchored protein n=1 Tax=Acrasis kona TaxID=1008807 RepID=A0AAW2Z3Q9_9EUKA
MIKGLVFVLLVAFAIVAKAENKCDELNASAEVVQSSHYRQYIQESQPIKDVQSVFVQHQYNVDFETLLPKKDESGSFLSRGNTKVIDVPLFSRDREYSTYPVITEKTAANLFNYEDATRSTRLFGVSNVIPVSEIFENEALIVIVPALVFNNATKLSEIHFTVVDASREANIIEKVKDDVEERRYPLFGQVAYAELKDEPIYNVEGQVQPGSVCANPVPCTQVDQEAIDLSSVSHQKIVSVKLLSAKKNPDAKFGVIVDFVALINTAGSIKVARYVLTTAREEAMKSLATTNVNTLYHKVVVPHVAGVASNGAVFKASPAQLFVSTTVNDQQIKAFRAVHPTLLSSQPSVHLIKINLATGDLETSVELNVFGFPADIDVKENQALVGINTIDVPSNVSAPIPENFVSHLVSVTFNATGSLGSITHGLIDGPTGDLSVKENKRRFVIYSVSYSTDGDASKALVGGSLVENFENHYKYTGHLLLVNYIPESKTNLIYNLPVGGGAAVLGVRRSIMSDGTENSQLFISTGAPDKAPSNDNSMNKDRGIKAALWMVDCHLPSAETERILFIVFVTLFSVISFTMILAIVGFTITGIYKYMQGRNERKSLLM